MSEEYQRNGVFLDAVEPAGDYYGESSATVSWTSQTGYQHTSRTRGVRAEDIASIPQGSRVNITLDGRDDIVSLGVAP